MMIAPLPIERWPTTNLTDSSVDIDAFSPRETKLQGKINKFI
jgi:hypothetical protein